LYNTFGVWLIGLMPRWEDNLLINHNKGNYMKRILYTIAIVCSIFQGVTAQETSTPKEKFSGYMFGDYFFNFERDTAISRLSNVATGGEKSYQAFQFRRIYFTYDNNISDNFTARLRLEADQGALTSDGKITTFVKDAFLRWKNIFQGSDLYFGIHPTPAYDISESFWEYRSLEKTIMDLRGIVSSRDFGLALRGKLDDAGIINYWAMVGNNSANKPETDKFKRYYLTFWFKPTKELQATVYGDYKAQASINDPTSTMNPPATLSHGVLTTAAFVGYGTPEYHVGVEGFLQSAANGYREPSATSLTSMSSAGVSLFGWYKVQSELSLVGRYDYFDPNTNGNAKGDARNYFLGGVAWWPNSRVSIIPNVQVETYESLPSGQTFDPSVTGRVTFYYIFL
jgi:hypothetical protein